MKIFQNPKFVAFLVVVALAAVSKNMIIPLLPDFLTSEQAKPAAPIGVPAKAAAVDPSALPMEMESIEWPEEYARDPFSFSALSLAKGVVKEKPKRYIRLAAVVIDSGSRLAVLNNDVVAEGERYRQFTVQNINANHVVLVDDEGAHQLTFNKAYGYIDPRFRDKEEKKAEPKAKSADNPAGAGAVGNGKNQLNKLGIGYVNQLDDARKMLNTR